MESLPKNLILKQISDSIDQKKDLSLDVIRKNSNLLIKIKIEMTDCEYFVDKKGVKWVKS